MSLSEPFVRRPVATTLLMLAVLLFGGLAYRELPVADLPNVDFPTIEVSAGLPGASPETMASSVATPLERQFSTIEGLDSMSSTNALGTSRITLQFDLSRDLDGAAQDVQTAITQAGSLLPPGMPTPPTFRKVNPADAPIMYLAFTSATLPLWKVDDYAETVVAQRLSMSSGVAQVQVFGGKKYAVRVELDPQALRSRGIGIDEVTKAIQAANPNVPSGSLDGTHRAFTIQTQGQLVDASVYRPIIVAYRNGAPVRLQDLGRVVDGVEGDKSQSWFVSPRKIESSVVLAVQRQPGTNTVTVANGVKKLLPILQKELPPSVELHVLFDRSLTIMDSFRDVRLTMLLTLGLVILVIFLFLRNASATMIPSLALPLSIIGTFAVMYVLGYTLDNLSLMALTLSIAFVVDDAIVMLENIVRHMERGKTAMQATFEGSREIGFTILSMTISLTAVFVPILFMPGVLGRLFREFAVTISVAILISGAVSLSLTPMLCSRLLRPETSRHHGRFYRTTERVFDAMLRGYDRSLRSVLRHRRATLLASLAILGVTLWLFTIVPKGFLPSEDQGTIVGTVEAAEGSSFDAMSRHQMAANHVVQKDPALRAAFSFVSTVGSSSPNQGNIFIHLIDSSRRAGIPEIIRRLRPEMSSIPGIRVFLQQLPSIRIGGRLTKSLYQYTLQGTDTKQLYRVSEAFEKRLQALPQLRDVTSDLLLRNPQVSVQVDREKAARLGVSVEEIENALYSAYGDRWISTIYAPNNQYKVLVGLEDRYKASPSALSLLYVRASDGSLVPLDSLAHLREDLGPMNVNHSGQLPAVTLSFDLQPGVSLSAAVTEIQALARKYLPATISASFQGNAQAFVSSLTGLTVLLIISIAVIYIVLGILYESFVHPVTILSGLPSAGFGALLTLMVFGTDLNVYSFVGLIMLIGIVKKNAIMQIDFALDAQRQRGLEPLEAIRDGCLVRFRPIMMTTMAALLGTLPIAIGFGAGADARRPLGLAVVGGLLFSQLVTLYLTPVYYTYLESAVGWWRERRSPGPPLPATIAGSEEPDRERLPQRVPARRGATD